jgi:hypothetical protein
LKKITKLKPYCQCSQINKGKLSSNGVETTTKDGITCDLCEYYVVWKNPLRVGKPYHLKTKNKQHRAAYKNITDKFYLEEYRVGS